jgi:beta-1,4-N-acetylglucosaminyltransferase
MSKYSKTKLCLVCSPGGHLYKTFMLKEWWEKYPHFWVTDPLTKKLEFPQNEKVYYGHFPVSRHPINFIKNLFLAYKLLRKEKPNLIFSTGAGIAPPFFIIGKLMGIKLVFMETFIFSPEPTLSGKLIYPFADHFVIQNKKLKNIYPRAKYWGKVL